MDRHEFEQALGHGEEQESLACCSPWGRKESYKTERLKNNSKSDEPFKRGSEESLLAFLKKKKILFIWPFQVVVVTCKLLIKACEI